MKMEKAKKVVDSVKIANDMQENIDRLRSLNQYDHEEDAKSASSGRFFIEFGGSSTHVRYFPKDNEIGDSITEFFVDLFGGIRNAARSEIESLIK